MIENVKPVSNPLTIIAIFAALAEVAGTVSLASVDRGLQGTFVWFVMGFPVLLVVAFFATLNWNRKVLYGPGDFRDESNFFRVGEAGIDQKLPGANPTEKLSVARDTVKKTATGSLFWLGHDLMWTADTLLRQGPLGQVLIGLDQAQHHLEQVGLDGTSVGTELLNLRTQVLATRKLSSSFRDECANKIGFIIDKTGATLEAAQPDFQKPPHWSRAR